MYPVRYWTRPAIHRQHWAWLWIKVWLWEEERANWKGCDLIKDGSGLCHSQQICGRAERRWHGWKETRQWGKGHERVRKHGFHLFPLSSTSLTLNWPSSINFIFLTGKWSFYCYEDIYTWASWTNNRVLSVDSSLSHGLWTLTVQEILNMRFFLYQLLLNLCFWQGIKPFFISPPCKPLMQMF